MLDLDFSTAEGKKKAIMLGVIAVGLIVGIILIARSLFSGAPSQLPPSDKPPEQRTGGGSRKAPDAPPP